MISYEVDKDGIAVLTWDMPDRAVNVINEESGAAFAEQVDKALKDDKVKGVIIASGKDSFHGGADLDLLGNLDDSAGIFERVRTIQNLLRQIETSGKPFVAAINGTALAGGFEICLACHYRVCVEREDAQIGLPEVMIGLLPGAGGTQRLPRMIGVQASAPLLLEGKRLRPARALQAGLVDKLVPAGDLMKEAKRWILEDGDPVKPWDKKGYRIPGGNAATQEGAQIFVVGNALLHKQTYGNYPATKAIMSCVYEGTLVDIDTGFKIEARYFTSLLRTKAAKAMIRTMYYSMMEANKLGRRPDGVPATDYKKIGVLGAGMMGAGIAYVSAKAGIEVVLIDRELAFAEKGKDYSKDLLDKLVGRGSLTEEGRDEILARITPSTDYADLKGCEMVIEAVFEDRKIKADVTKKTEAVIAKDAVFASNTSTLPITGLAEASARPDNFIGLHFFSPVDRMPLVEIIRGEKTSDVALAKAMDYVKRIGKTPIVVNDSRGFYTSRVFGTYVQEGIAMLAEGVNPALIENAGRMAGMPVGPLAIADEVSIDLIYHIMKQTKADLGDKAPSSPSEPVVTLFAEKLKRLGKKAGKGFYDYPKDGKKRLWPDLGQHFPRAETQPDIEDVKRRLLYIQGIETARCMEENVVTDARDADVGSILGWGFAPFAGGVLSFIDGIGVEQFVRECDALAQAHGPRFTPPKLLRDMAGKGQAFYQKAA